MGLRDYRTAGLQDCGTTGLRDCGTTGTMGVWGYQSVDFVSR